MSVPCLGCGLSWLLLLSMSAHKVLKLSNQVKDDGLRTSWFRGNSYFRIGWDWVKAALLNGWKLLHSVTFTGNQDPNPALLRTRVARPHLASNMNNGSISWSLRYKLIPIMFYKFFQSISILIVEAQKEAFRQIHHAYQTLRITL